MYFEGAVDNSDSCLTLALPHLTPVHTCSQYVALASLCHPVPPSLYFCCLFLEFPSGGEGFKKGRVRSSVPLSDGSALRFPSQNMPSEGSS